MKILLTGATGYIGKRLLPHLIEAGHHVVCAVRDVQRFSYSKDYEPFITVIELDLLEEVSLQQIPEDIDGAYYLIHSMSSSDNYQELEEKTAMNFRNRMNEIEVKHVIYLSGIANDKKLSDHLSSRKKVEEILHSGDYPCTTLRAGIIIGSGSASFEIIRDIVEKLPIMVTPKWLKTKCQPIAIRDVLKFLILSLFNERTYHQNFDIGGTDVLTYKEMLLKFGEVRGLKRFIFTVPVMTPRLSSYWLYFVTSTSYKLAKALVDSMKAEVVCRNDNLKKLLNINTISYKEAIEKAFVKIEDHQVISSWKDSFVSSDLKDSLNNNSTVPEFGCFLDKRRQPYKHKLQTIERIWRIGGDTGWYYGDFLWKIRGYLDKMVGGVGLRRGRTNKTEIYPGDALDFWRVMIADKEQGRLVLFAEMRLPGEAWLEFKIEGEELVQTATFRPKGVLGRLYWWSVYPFHGVIFRGMLRALTE